MERFNSMELFDDKLYHKITLKCNSKEKLKHGSYQSRIWFKSRCRSKVNDDYIYMEEEKKMNQIHSKIFRKLLPIESEKLPFLNFINYILKSELNINRNSIMKVLDKIDIKRERAFDEFMFLDLFNNSEIISELEKILVDAIARRRIKRKSEFIPSDLTSLLKYIEYTENRKRILTKYNPITPLDFLVNKMEKLLNLNTDVDGDNHKIKYLKKEIIKRKLNKSEGVQKILRGRNEMRKSIIEDSKANSPKNIKKQLLSMFSINAVKPYVIESNEKLLSNSIEKLVNKSEIKGKEMAIYKFNEFSLNAINENQVTPDYIEILNLGKCEKLERRIQKKYKTIGSEEKQYSSSKLPNIHTPISSQNVFENLPKSLSKSYLYQNSTKNEKINSIMSVANLKVGSDTSNLKPKPLSLINDMHIIMKLKNSISKT